jgi:FtsH-binding integral membrane protein
LVIGLLAVASGLLFNLGGLAATADLLTSWFVGFAPLMAAGGAYPAIFLLSLYEPLILLAGLFGLSVVLLRRRLIDLFLGWWFFGGIALDLLRSGRTAGELLVPLVPLTLLGGLALGMLWDSFCAPRRQGNEGRRQGVGIVAAIGLVLGGFAYVELMSYTRMGGWTFLLPVAALGLFIGFVALFWIWEEGSSAWQGAALAAVIVLLGCTVATGSRLNYGRLADPRQPLVRAPIADGLPNLVTTLKQVSSWRAGDPYLLDIIADRRLGQAVEWQLRRFDNVTWVDTVSQLSQSVSAGHPTAILAPATDAQQGDGLLPLDEGYLGQGFAIRAFWTPTGLSGQSLVRWIILRSADTPVNFDRAVLWVRQE